MPITMQVIKHGSITALSFPSYEEGSHLEDLVQHIAEALDTTARRPIGSLLEGLVGFVGYPKQFALWWDGFTGELGCSNPRGIDMDSIAARLTASGAFVIG